MRTTVAISNYFYTPTRKIACASSLRSSFADFLFVLYLLLVTETRNKITHKSLVCHLNQKL